MKVNPNTTCNYLYYPIIILKKSNLLKKNLTKSNVSFRKYYSAVHTLDYYKKNTNFKKISLKYTNLIRKKIIALPLFSDMEKKELNYLLKIFKKIYKK